MDGNRARKTYSFFYSIPTKHQNYLSNLKFSVLQLRED